MCLVGGLEHVLVCFTIMVGIIIIPFFHGWCPIFRGWYDRIIVAYHSWWVKKGEVTTRVFPGMGSTCSTP